jgi:SRSO17 transposase
MGLIWVVKFRSVREIASQLGQGNSQGLHHFIRHSAKSSKRLEEENRNHLAQVIKSEETVLILDDTPCPRKGKRIEGIGYHHTIHGPVQGLCAVTAILKTGSQCLSWAIRGYRSKKSCTQELFKSKVELARQILEESFSFFPRGLTVVMDVWYGCASVLNPIQQAGWTFLCAIKANRFLIANGKKFSARHLAKGPRKYQTIRVSKKKRFRVAKKRVYLPNVGPVLVFITKLKGGESRFFVTNNLDMTGPEMVRLYTGRFSIELFHKDIKQHLGFTEMFMRSWDGIQTHWILLAIAYNTISLWNGSNSGSFRSMIRHFRNSVSHNGILALPKK